VKAITQRNNNFSKEDFVEIERRLGGPVNAARSAGVSYPTWYRWREGRISLSESRKKLLLLLLHTTRMPSLRVEPREVNA